MLGLVPSGTDAMAIRPSERLAFEQSAITLHQQAIATRNFTAKTSPRPKGQVLSTVPRAASVRIDERALKTWAMATDQTYAPIVAEKGTAFVELTPSESLRPLELGGSWTQFLVNPISEVMPTLVDAKALKERITTIRENGATIAWISVAGGYFENSYLNYATSERVHHAISTLKEIGVDGRRITAVTGTPDIEGLALRIRVFGYR
jgi:hypothetical protein